MLSESQLIEVSIDHLLYTGEGVGSFQGRSVLVFGAFPGERVLALPLRKHRGAVIARLESVLEPLPERREPREPYAQLTGSPWQVIPEELQLEYKKHLHGDGEITPSPNSWNYRNKLEFSFTEDEQGRLSLAFHMRGSSRRMQVVEGSVLGGERMNACAKQIVDVLRKQGVRAYQLKTLIIRQSFSEDMCIAALYVTDENVPPIQMQVEHLIGWHSIYSDPRSPASIATRVLYSEGSNILSEDILNVTFSYHYDSFFQVNPPAFSLLMQEVKKRIQPGNILLDLYCGVGTIGLLLANQFQQVRGFEIDTRAVEMARHNALSNNISNAEFIDGPVEKQKLAEALQSADTLIVDPPRSGLHPKVLKSILKCPPQHFIYISCNPHTQARDQNLLQEKYNIVHRQLFDFYPQTPHVESLLVLERKSMLY